MMTREGGGGAGMKILRGRGGLQKLLDTRKGDSEKIKGGSEKCVHFKNKRRGVGGLLKKRTASVGSY